MFLLPRRIAGAGDTLQETNQTVNEAKNVLKLINYNIIKEKLWLILIIVALLAVRPPGSDRFARPRQATARTSGARAG